MQIHQHSHTSPSDHPYAILARTEATIGGQRFVLVDFSPATNYAKGERKVGREVYRIEDGLEIHIGYLSLSAEAAFERDLTRWLGDVNTRRYSRSGRELGACERAFGSFRAVQCSNLDRGHEHLGRGRGGLHARRVSRRKRVASSLGDEALRDRANAHSDRERGIS